MRVIFTTVDISWNKIAMAVDLTLLTIVREITYVACTLIQTIFGLFFLGYLWDRKKRKEDQIRDEKKREEDRLRDEKKREEDRLRDDKLREEAKQKADAENSAAVLGKKFDKVEGIFDRFKRKVVKLREKKVTGRFSEYDVLAYMCHPDNQKTFDKPNQSHPDNQETFANLNQSHLANQETFAPWLDSPNQSGGDNTRYGIKEVMSDVDSIMKLFVAFRLKLSLIHDRTCPNDIKDEFSSKITEMGQAIEPFVTDARKKVIEKVLIYFGQPHPGQQNSETQTSDNTTSRAAVPAQPPTNSANASQLQPGTQHSTLAPSDEGIAADNTTPVTAVSAQPPTNLASADEQEPETQMSTSEQSIEEDASDSMPLIGVVSSQPGIPTVIEDQSESTPGPSDQGNISNTPRAQPVPPTNSTNPVQQEPGPQTSTSGPSDEAIRHRISITPTHHSPSHSEIENEIPYIKFFRYEDGEMDCNISCIYSNLKNLECFVKKEKREIMDRKDEIEDKIVELLDSEQTSQQITCDQEYLLHLIRIVMLKIKKNELNNERKTNFIEYVRGIDCRLVSVEERIQKSQRALQDIESSVQHLNGIHNHILKLEDTPGFLKAIAEDISAYIGKKLMFTK